MTGNTWFMSSLNATYEEDEAEYLYFPSNASKGQILCINAHDTSDGTKNSYALAWPETLPESATLLKGLTYVSDTYYSYDNLCHGLSALAPFVGWSMKNQCSKPARWVLFHWGELRTKMSSWVQHIMEAQFGDVRVEKFEGKTGPYCFEKAVVMRHDLGRMVQEKTLEVLDMLRCKAREFCDLNPTGRGTEVNERGVPIIRLTLLMRRGSRSFRNASVVADIFAKECAEVEGCILHVAQSEELSFCDQVRSMTYTGTFASPHGQQHTNMIFMNRGSSVMEFFPYGWLEHAGIGQYVYHWMAEQSGMKHKGAWRDPVGKKCPYRKQDLECFFIYKDGKVGHNETYFAEWARKVINQVRVSKIQQASESIVSKQQVRSSVCEC
ncbi:uncharacterized protein LOC130757915 [Actinidia eriantha]|uniref:uncharacterized protein LOC130757915 n=1 Tax=Actinidia eriantha TaxID=165200 RepID=UPI00258A8E53|nr:uncharacterized protein LOC130757915 [Actinidia eriantha]